MITISEQANKLLLDAKINRGIQPVTDWKIPHEVVDLNGFSFTKIRKITILEEAIITEARKGLESAQEQWKQVFLLVFSQIGIALELEYVGEVIDLLKDKDKTDALIKEKNIDEELIKGWQEVLAEARKNYDVEAYQNDYDYFIVTLFMWLRCDKEWDFPDTDLLDKDTYDLILNTINEEINPDGIVESSSDIEVKKP